MVDEIDLIKLASGRKTLRKPVKSRIFEVVGPYTLRERSQEIRDVPDKCLLLETLITGICHADLRYVSCSRPPEILQKRLPLCVFHEGVARVTETGYGAENLSAGDLVIVIPNIPCYIHNPIKYPDIYHACRSCRPEGVGENLCEDVRFISSNAHGLSRSFLIHPASCILRLPEKMPEKVGVLAEPLSVINRALKVSGIKLRDRVAVLGGGFMGYLTAAVISQIYGVPKSDLLVTDIFDFKLEKFKDFATTLNTKTTSLEAFADTFDMAFECAGGKAAEVTIDQALSLLAPGGRCVLVGVSEDKVPVRTRTMLEKGLSLKGTTRSAAIDYPDVLRWLEREDFRRLLERIIYPQMFYAKDSESILAACKVAEDPMTHGKVLIDWRI
ncbi:MAG: alcohol dehydrogenase catalytic domain-containing protein [Nitrososphaerota archaeon]|nr:alcohol dehydrogenase catalytic domain-containing protein [Candidatus Bathyarchaeota archaeon]MDW8048334.1 alcohol dehydrogenase catalytic domain-containing protein [Nitrososphaerota archaeon]